MRTPLAWHNLTHQKTRTAVAVAGVAFAIILIFLQLGFRGSAEATATFLYDRLDDFDIFLVAVDYRDMNQPGALPRERIYQAMTVPGVRDAYPLYVNFNLWRTVQTGSRQSMLLVGVRPTDPIFLNVPELTDPALMAELQRPDTVLVDRGSHPDFGLRDGVMPEGVTGTEIGRRHVEVVGRFSLGTGFASDGAVLTSDETFSRLLGGWPLERINLGLVRVEPGADPHVVQQRLREALPPDVIPYLREELFARERDFWLNTKSIGVLFTCGVCVAFVVGVIFVYQIISTDIANHLPEYATLKAVGYGEGYLSMVVLQQAAFLAVLSYVPGFLVSLSLYELTRRAARVPIEMNLLRAVGVFAASLLMCALSGLFALRKVRSADPADLF